MSRRMILLVSGQPMPNLLAALEPELGVSAAHLIVSGDMRASGQGDRLGDILIGRGLRVIWHDVSDPFSPEATRGLVARLLGEDPKDVIINVTGGTKPMALGAYRAAAEAGVRDILYMEHETGLLRWLEGNRPPFRAAARLTLAEVISAHGASSTPGRAPPEDRLSLARQLGDRLEGGLLEAWNRLMAEVDRQCGRGRRWQPSAVPLERAFSASPAAPPCPAEALAEVATTACAQGLAALAGGHLTISRREDHGFLAGGWFEALVWQSLAEARDMMGLHDIACNLVVTDAAGAQNEIDLAAMQGRHLLVFECKTARLTGRDIREKAGGVLYRLAHLARLGGLGTRLFLVSRLPLALEVRARFASGRVEVIDGVCPAALPGALARAIGPA